MALTRARGFSVDVSLDQTMHKSGAEECELWRAKKVATELHQGSPSSSAVTHWDDAVGKAAARPEIFEFPGPGAKKIDPGHLKKPSLRSHPNTKGGYHPRRDARDRMNQREDPSSAS